MFVGDLLGELDHLGDVVGCDRPFRGLGDVQPLDVRFEHRSIVRGDVPDRFLLGSRGLFHLVVARVGVAGQVTDIGDVDDVAEIVTLPLEHPPERIGEQERAHVADMLVVIDRRPAGVDARLVTLDRAEFLDLASERIVEFEGGVGHVAGCNGRG